MNRHELILKLYSIYTGQNGRFYLGWLEGQTNAQLEICYRRAFE